MRGGSQWAIWHLKKRYLEEGNILLAKPSDSGRPQPFRIYKITTPIDGLLEVQARHISYKAWNCKERQKGARGNGCQNRIIREDELMQTVLDMLGWEEMYEGRFRSEVSRVLVYPDRIEIE